MLSAGIQGVKSAKAGCHAALPTANAAIMCDALILAMKTFSCRLPFAPVGFAAP
jgi:hypothetical protein